MNAKKTDFRLFGQCLMERGLITQEQLAEAIGLQKAMMAGRKLGEILVELGYITNIHVSEALADQMAAPMLVLAEYEVPRHIQGLIDGPVARRHNVIPVEEEGDTLVVATTDPGNTRALDELSRLLGRPLQPVLASLEDIDRALDKYYGIG